VTFTVDKGIGHRGAAAFVSVKTQFENLGDALITRELIRQLSARVPTVADCSRCPETFVETLDLEDMAGVKVLRSAGLGAMLLAMVKLRLSGRPTYYFLLPGGLGGGRSTRQVIFGQLNTVLIAALKTIGVRVCQVGISYDGLDRRYASILRGRVPFMYSHAVRDVFSQSHAAELGIRVDEIVPDLAFGLFERVPLATGERSAIALSFRADKYRDRTREIEALVEAMVHKADGAEVKFVAQVGRDAAFMRGLMDNAASIPGARLSYHQCTDDIEACRRIYSDCRAIYSNRLHALLLAMSAGAVPVAVVDRKADVKIVGVFDSMGLAHQVADLGSMSLPPDTNLDTAGAVHNAAAVAQYFDRVLAA
jgi:polysaccharide pyruvyl transferase WcaK-like protein